MLNKTTVVFVGPAGSGKSTLLSAYSRWLEKEIGARVYRVNLDTAAEYIPYVPDFDVRVYIDAHRIAKEFGLGPNGALVKSMDILAERVDIVEDAIRQADADFVLVDTPGQMEVFIFRDVAPKIFEAVKRVSKDVLALFVLDGEVIKRFEDYAFISIMSVALQARLGVDVVPIINKYDVVPNLELMGDLISDADLVTENLRKSGLYGEMLAKIMDILWLYAKATRVPKVSAKNMQGLEELHRIVHEFTCSCGDLT